jgi:hypothetical protein
VIVDKYIEFLRAFIGEDWIKAEIKKIEDRSRLKEVGSEYEDYHPFVKYHYEIKYLLRRAEALKQEDVLLQESYYRLSIAGYLIMVNLNKIRNHSDLKNRLRDANQFYDAIWEFEVATMFLKNKIKYSFKEPVQDDSNDITCFIDDKPLEIECKNKHTVYVKHRKNQMFAHILANKLSNTKLFKDSTYIISFDEGNFEHIKSIVKCMIENLNSKKNYTVLQRYGIQRISGDEVDVIETLQSDTDVREVIVVKEIDKKDLFSNDVSKGNTQMQFIFKYPEANTKIKNIDKLLKDANSQLPNSGVVFLKVPLMVFNDAIKEITDILNTRCSNLKAVKVIAIEEKFIEGSGVKISRKEELVINQRCKESLTEKELNFLKADIAFSIFK